MTDEIVIKKEDFRKLLLMLEMAEWGFDTAVEDWHPDEELPYREAWDFFEAIQEQVFDTIYSNKAITGGGEPY